MKTILITEEKKGECKNLTKILVSANFKLLKAGNGQQVLDFALKYQPDLIISNVNLPLVDGLSLAHIIRHEPEIETIPIILLSSGNDKNDFRNAMEAGANDCLSMPFKNNELLKAIENIFRMTDILKKHWSVDLQSANNLPFQVSNHTIEKLTLESSTTYYQKRTIVYKKGKWPDYVYYIVKGKVRTYKVHEEGRQLVMGLYNTGDFFGYNALIEETTYKETAETTEESELVCIPRVDFENMVYKNQAVANKLLKMLARTITEHEHQLICNTYDTLRKKVASALICLENKYKSNNELKYCIDMSRNEIAAIAGTAAESLIRTLNDFKSESIIQIRKNHIIEITDSEKLHSLLR